MDEYKRDNGMLKVNEMFIYYFFETKSWRNN